MRIATGLFVALVVGLVANPPAHSELVRVLELIAIVVLGFIALASVVELVISHIAGWQDSERSSSSRFGAARSSRATRWRGIQRKASSSR